MMEAALSSRNYTINQVKPLLETQMKYEFLPQTVPAYAATEQFNELRKKHPDYAYKEATLNPTNPRDRAADWEADVVNMFRNTPTTTRGHRRARHADGPRRSTCRGRSRSRTSRASTATARSRRRRRR